MIVTQNNIRVKLGTEKDVAQYIEIQKRILTEQNVSEDLIQKKIDGLPCTLDKDNYQFFLTKMGDNTVGYLNISCGDTPAEKHVCNIKLELLQYYDLPKVRRKMLICVEGYAIEKNMKRLETNVRKSYIQMDPCVDLGYKIEGKRTYASFSEANGYEDNYIMAKILY